MYHTYFWFFKKIFCFKKIISKWVVFILSARNMTFLEMTRKKSQSTTMFVEKVFTIFIC